jgi:AraC family transcriptional regulator
VNIDVVDRAPARVAYLRYTGPFGEPLARFWRGSVSPWLAQLDLIDCPRYGICLDETRYDACVELPVGLSLPDAAQATIAGGRYAITCFKGTAAGLGSAWAAFFAAVPARGLARDGSRPVFEHYPRGATWDARTGRFACQLCLPLSQA